jgi:hypothetical protein
VIHVASLALPEHLYRFYDFAIESSHAVTFRTTSNRMCLVMAGAKAECEDTSQFCASLGDAFSGGEDPQVSQPD